MEILHITHVEASSVQSLFTENFLTTYLTLVLMLPIPKILSSLPASRHGTPNTVTSIVIDTSNLLYSLASVITGLDFNPTGEYMASIDSGGVCLISDVTTANYRFHVTLGDWGNYI